jgi:sodium/bile acid cotransporter 7
MSFLIQDEEELPPALCVPGRQKPVDEENSTAIVPTEQEEEAVPDQEVEKAGRCRSFTRKSIDFYINNQFVINISLSILLAKLYPPLGAIYLCPEITATWIAVAIIFVLAGMGLKTEEFSKAFQRVYFNGFVQFFNFGFVSIVIFAVSRLLVMANMLDEALADGMVVCASLLMAVNVVIILSAATGADEAAAIFNATFGNIIGIFLSPVLILMYLGTTGNVSLGKIFSNLALRVVVPLVVGQAIQKKFAKVRDFFKTHKKKFKKVQEYCLVFIVYTVFCRTFIDGAGAGIGDVFLMILYQFLLLVALMGVAWYSLKFLFRDEPELRVMGLFGCVQKTAALGVPLIGSIYEGNPNEGQYTLPILIWHPMQLVVGSILVGRLSAFIQSERNRLDAKEQENEVTIAADIEGHDDRDSSDHHGEEGQNE